MGEKKSFKCTIKFELKKHQIIRIPKLFLHTENGMVFYDTLYKLLYLFVFREFVTEPTNTQFITVFDIIFKSSFQVGNKPALHYLVH